MRTLLQKIKPSEIEKASQLCQKSMDLYAKGIEASELWLEQRECFSWGREHRYPYEMMKHHFPKIS